MGSRGPKPKPVPGQRADRKANLIQPVEGKPTPPAHLDDVAKVEFVRITDLLHAQGTLSLTDGDAIALYADTYSLYLRAKAAVDLAGLSYKNEKTGARGKNPDVGVQENGSKAMAALLLQFGLTPAARTRVTPNLAREVDVHADKWKGIL